MRIMYNVFLSVSGFRRLLVRVATVSLADTTDAAGSRERMYNVFLSVSGFRRLLVRVATVSLADTTDAAGSRERLLVSTSLTSSRATRGTALSANARETNRSREFSVAGRA